MITNRDDDYLICKHYRNHINDVSAEHKDFITFTHNDNHFFAWINDGKIVMRSEAYPSQEKMERGIKAIIKNRGLQERYSIDSQHGAHFLVLWGGGNHQKHTGNMDKHNEIGRSCPVKDKNDLAAMMGFMGKDFVNGVFGRSSGAKTSASSGAAIAAATAGAASIAASSSKKTKSKGKAAATAATGSASYSASSGGSASGGSVSGGSSSGGGFNWKWLLPLLLLIPLFFLWKGCGDKATTATKTKAKTEISAADKAKADAAKLAADRKAKADADAKAKADAEAAKFAADKKAAEAKAAKAKARGGSGVSRNAGTGGISYRGNKSDGY